MKEYNLDKLVKVSLRDTWEREDADFTTWLSQQENLNLLAETIGNDLELELDETEKKVGAFRADIVCSDASQPGNHWVLIENQFGLTDHDHLGKLLTYAAGLDTVTNIWIAEKFKEEHRAVLDLLNKITDEKFRFFGIEIELLRIGTSKPAPNFKMIAKPNDWERSVSNSTKYPKTQANIFTKKYFTGLINYMDVNKTFLNLQTPADTYQNFSIGKAGVFIRAIVTPTKNNVRVELYMDKTVKHYFFAIFQKKNDIEKIIENLIWNRPREKATAIYLKFECDPSNEENWQDQFAWLKEKLEIFHKTFKPIIDVAKKLKDEEFERLENEYYESIGEEQEVPDDMIADEDDF